MPRGPDHPHKFLRLGHAARGQLFLGRVGLVCPGTRLAERVDRRLRYYDGVTHQGMFSVPKYLRQAIAAESRIITRAAPLFVP